MKDDRFKDHPYQKEQVERYVEGAYRKLKTANKIAGEDSEAAYQLAYEAMLKASIGLIMKHGKRPRSLPGHHVAIIEMATKILNLNDDRPMKMFDHMRRNRNTFLYDDISFLSEQEVKEALLIAKAYLDIVKSSL